jgi:hypothetical protein
MARTGRPTKYNSKMLKKAQEYLKNAQDVEYDWIKTDGNSSTTKEHRIKVNLPSVEGLSSHLKVDTDTIVEWGKIYPDFSVTLSEIRNEQKKRLISNGLSGEYNPLIAKLVLSANHGMKEKTDVTSNDQPISVNVTNYGNSS